jgi:PAS domain S-box-containing protein
MSSVNRTGNQRGRILIVDDTPANLQLLVDILRGQGYVVHPAAEGELALRFIESTLPDLILLDIMMPDIDGYQLCARLKADERTRDIPVIFISAADQVIDKVRAFAVGGVDYIVKPFEAEEVLARVTTHLALRDLQKGLEERVRKRTAELMEAITERKQAAEQLAASEAELRALFAAMTDIVMVVDQHGRYLKIAPTNPQLLYRPAQDLLGKRLHDVFPTAQADFFLEQIQTALASKQATQLEYALPIDGKETWFAATISPMSDETVVCVARDITKRKWAEEALRASEKRFATAFQASPVGLIISTPDEGRFLAVNDHFLQTTGYTREEVIGRTTLDLSLWADPEERARTIQRLRQEGSLRNQESTYRTRCGEVRDALFSMELIELEGRECLLTALVDITERKRAEQALREGEERFRMLSEASFEGIWIHDQGKILDLNRTMAAMFGYEPAELIGRNVLELAAPESRALILEKIRAESEEPYEAVGIRKDGTRFHGEIIGRTIPWYGRKCRVTAIRDITERKRTEQALVESHNLLNAVVEGTSDAVFVKDFKGRYLMINSAGARFLGKTVEEVIGKDDLELFTPDTARAVMEHDRQVMASGESLTFEETATAAGVTRTYLATKNVYRDVHGKVIGLIGIARDITEMKRLEEQFRQAQKMEAVGRLAGGVAHDFNNLLTVINGYSGLVFNRLSADDPSRKLIAEIQKAGERAANLTHQLLAFSRKQVLQPQVVSLNTLLSELLKLLQRLIGEDIELALVTGAAPGLAKVDPGQFEQAIVNLAVNARDAMPQGGRLIIETHDTELDEDYARHHSEVRPGRYVLVAVSDSGHGMDEATRARIFEPFFTTKGPGKGTGLGLAMVYGFVKQSGGHIEVYSELGHGTTFKVYLPRAEKTIPFTKSSTDLLKIPKGTETVLLVEDEDAVRTLSKSVLQSSGYTVLEARDGQEAVTVAQQHQGPIHMLVSDVVMPRMSGRQLADLLVQTRPQMRILFISGYTDEAMLRHGVLEASAAFLQKPFTPISLARKVREVLDTRRGISKE